MVGELFRNFLHLTPFLCGTVARFSLPPAMHILEFFLLYFTHCVHTCIHAKCAYSSIQEWVGGFIKYFLLCGM